MVKQLHIDIETFSSVDIRKSGAYKYAESVDFEILLVGYSYGITDPVTIIDLAKGEVLPESFISDLENPEIEKHAHNANFERVCFKAIGYDIPADQWHCSAIKASYLGLPSSLAQASKALELKEHGKLSTGVALIKMFCVPVKPTKRNNFKSRMLPEDDEDAWEEFKEYCAQDVVAEMHINEKLKDYDIIEFERRNYILDQKINDIGIKVDSDFAEAAKYVDDNHSQNLRERMVEITGLDNPNSPKQLRDWLSNAMKEDIKSLAKDEVATLLEKDVSETVREVLDLRVKSSRTSTTKYQAMDNCQCYDDRVHGLFQFYGANRTGRWAGRLVQLQNLRRNDLDDLEGSRALVFSKDMETIYEKFEDVSDVVSQLVRTAFIPEQDKIFRIADFSAIEARVVAWLANEQWRLDVFKGDGKIYEASAAMMFDVPIELVTRDSEYRYKSKIAELALGYQGGIGAMTRMGGEEMGLSESEMKEIVRKWRLKSPNIVKFWAAMERCAKLAFSCPGKKIKSGFRGIVFYYDRVTLRIFLPSGRWLSYWNPSLGTNSFGSIALKFKGIDQTSRNFVSTDTYGGKLVENITQAVARDALAHSMLRLDEEGFNIIMHVHDEIICEEFKDNTNQSLERMCEIMGEQIPWAPDLILTAEGFETQFYKKD